MELVRFRIYQDLVLLTAKPLPQILCLQETVTPTNQIPNLENSTSYHNDNTPILIQKSIQLFLIQPICMPLLRALYLIVILLYAPYIYLPNTISESPRGDPG